VFLVGCPCNVPAFRRHMARLQWSPIWLMPGSSQSPDETLARMDPGITITAISGSKDRIALPEFAQAYVETALARGITASMVLVPEQGHEILNSAAVMERVGAAARQ
jgi:hypothetical protein